MGPPDQRILAQIPALTDLNRLNHLLERILDVTTWDELFDSSQRDNPVTPEIHPQI